MTINFKKTNYIEASHFLKKLTGTSLTFGEMLEAFRQSEDLSQTDFAKKIGISKSHLCDI